MLLSFERGRFVLSEPTPAAQNHLSKRRDYWLARSEDLFETTSLRAARVFRKFSDESARRVFTRAFVKFYEAPDLSDLTFLDPHQVDGVRWILTRSRSYLAHAPGAGKTGQAIVAATLCEAPGPALFIVPPGLTANWAREIRKFSAMLGAAELLNAETAVVGRSEDRDEVDWSARFVIVPDSMLTKDWVLAGIKKLAPAFIAVDEASRFKEATSKRTVALFGGRSQSTSFPGLIHKARHVVLMDGSPMPNRPLELWAPTFAMNPEAIDCMDVQEFGMRYCGPRRNEYGEWEFKGASNLDELHEKIQAEFMHVVTEDKLEHPERLRSIVFTDQKAPRDWGKSFSVNMQDIRDLGDEASDGELATMRRKIGEKKVDWVVEYVANRLKEKNERILLFAWHREVCQELYTKLARNHAGALIMGGTKPEYREHAFDVFQAGLLEFIVGNIAAMGRGHNLQRADRVIFAEYSWTDELNLQCEKRASRKGREKDKPVRCEYIVLPNTLDEVVLNAVFTKARNVKRVIG